MISKIFQQPYNNLAKHVNQHTFNPVLKDTKRRGK